MVVESTGSLSGKYGSGEDMSESQQARTGNAEARRGKMLLDYFRARLPDTKETWKALDGWLGPRAERPMGWRGWYDRSAAVLDGGIVAWCADKERAKVQGVLVDLPGRALACLGEKLAPFVQWALEQGNVTRADWAIDDRKGLVTYDRIRETEAAGGLVTKWQGMSERLRRHHGKVTGWTIYIGSRMSTASLRIYDKAAEQGVEGHWVRVEFETKGEFADALCREYMDFGSRSVVGQINRRARFCEQHSKDKARKRWRVCWWWRELLGNLERGPSLAAGERPTATVEHLKKWTERAAGPSLATIVQAEGGDLDWLFGMLDRAIWRIRPRHRVALALAGGG